MMFKIIWNLYFFHELCHVVFYTFAGLTAEQMSKDLYNSNRLLFFVGQMSKYDIAYLYNDFDIKPDVYALTFLRYCSECLYYLNKSEISARIQNTSFDINHRNFRSVNEPIKYLKLISSDFNKYCMLYDAADKIISDMEQDNNVKKQILDNDMTHTIFNIYFKDQRNKNVFGLLNMFKKRCLVFLKKSIKLYKYKLKLDLEADKTE